MPRFLTRVNVPGLLIVDHPRGVTITTPYGEQIRATVRFGEWDLPTEAILGIAGIHSPEMRVRCAAALESARVPHPWEPELFNIPRYTLLRVLQRHGGTRPPLVGLPHATVSVHEDCTTPRFDEMMADLLDMDEEPSTRYETFMEFVHDLLALHPNVRTGIFASMMLTSRLEHWGDGRIFQLPQAIAYAIAVHPEWRKAAQEWLLPHRRTWIPEYLERNPKVRAMVRLAAKKVPNVPSWLRGP